MSTPNDIVITIEKEGEDWRVYTAKNGNGGWAVGVPFAKYDGALRVANAIAQSSRLQGDHVTKVAFS